MRLADFIVAGTLLLAGVMKLVSVRNFAKAVFAFELFSARISAVIALVVPVIEVFLGAALLFSIYRTGVHIGVVVLLLTFAAVMVAAIQRGKTGSACGCFGDHSTVGWPLVIRDLGLAALAMAPFGHPAISWTAFTLFVFGPAVGVWGTVNKVRVA